MYGPYSKHEYPRIPALYLIFVLVEAFYLFAVLPAHIYKYLIGRWTCEICDQPHTWRDKRYSLHIASLETGCCEKCYPYCPHPMKGDNP